MQVSDSVIQTRKYWNHYADRWKKLADDPGDFYTRRNQWLKTFIRRNHIAPCATLDIGCSTGMLSHTLAKEGFDTYGTDVSDKLVCYAAERLSATFSDAKDRFLVSEDGQNPFERKMFGLVTIIGVFPYISDQKTYIEKLKSQIKPGGYIIATGANRFSIYIMLHILKHCFNFRPNRGWWKMLVNLARTGIWSGGYVDYRTAKQVHNSAQFDNLFAELGMEKLDEFDLFHLSFLDKNPLNRKGLSKFFARFLGWSHVGVFKLPSAGMP